MTADLISRRSISTVLLALAGPIIWAAHFLVTYALIGVACARWPLELEIAGIGVRSAIIGGLTVLAFIGIGVVLRQAARNTAEGRAAAQRFLDWLTRAAALLAGLGIIWSAAAGLMVQSCR